MASVNKISYTMITYKEEALHSVKAALCLTSLRNTFWHVQRQTAKEILGQTI